jgi:crotonobetainyl-CoA:carnitine CoA-transferase CaiB-like acyl-CoA transferase|tara:strand:- start:1316 stop:2473 length:1158 start_codon:yes stop_codon:yes gene_type:complete
VIDLTRVLAGPYCSMLLGDMGAEVLKIEEPVHGDDTRAWAPFHGGVSTFFLGMNRSKKSVALDLKASDGADALRRLIGTADVLIENFRPGSLKKLGFDYDTVRAWNPQLVYCSITGYGQQGPKRDLPGYDAVIQAESGLMHVTGARDGPPTRVGVAITDYLSGLYAMNGILLALRDRDETGLGQHVDIALLDAMTTALALPANVLFATGEELGREGNDHHSLTPYEPVTVRDGLVMVAVGNQRLWHQFCLGIGEPHLEADPRFATNTDRMRHRKELKALLDSRLAGLTRDELLGRLRAHAVPCGQVRTIVEALADPQLAARDMVIELTHPDLGTVRALGNPIKLSRSPAAIHRPPPALGEHTDGVLAELAGLEGGSGDAGRRRDG